MMPAARGRLTSYRCGTRASRRPEPAWEAGWETGGRD
jgi:hypothetical protein